MKASEWAFDRIEEAFELVAQDEAEKMSIVKEIMLRSTEHLRRIIAPVGGQGGVTISYMCPHCNSFCLEDCVWWVSGGKSTKWWSAICAEKYDWKQPNRLSQGSSCCRLCGSKAAMTSDRVVSDLMLPLWEEVLWPFLDAWDSVCLRTTSTQWNVPGRYGPHGELFFFLLKNEPMVLRELVRFGPSIPVEAMKACAFVGLHMMAEGGFLADGQWLLFFVEAARVKTTWAMARCSSSGDMDLATQLPSSCKTGRWQR